MSIFRRSAAALVAASFAIMTVAGCSFGEKKRASGPTPFDKTMVDDCYTVDLFSPAKIEKPGKDVPAEWRKFSGKWGSAAWDGKWCHDLYVMKINPDGSVNVMDLHAPYEPWGKPATAFRRKAWFSKDGRLHVAHGSVKAEYWIKDGRLYGLRKEGSGALRIAMQPRVNKRL